MKKIAITALILFLLAGAAQAAERTPLRVARLPLVIRSYMQPDAKTIERLETKIDRALHVPLNDVLNAVEFLPEGECEEAFADVFAELKKNKRKAKLKEAMQPLAEQLNADIVVCPVLTDFDERIYMGGWDMGLRIDSNAGVEIAGYDKRTGETFDKSRYRHYHDDYGTRGMAAYLAEECMDRAIDDAKLRTIFGSMKEFVAAEETKNNEGDTNHDG